jgi:hypothetical protein
MVLAKNGKKMLALQKIISYSASSAINILWLWIILALSRQPYLVVNI